MLIDIFGCCILNRQTLETEKLDNLVNLNIDSEQNHKTKENIKQIKIFYENIISSTFQNLSVWIQKDLEKAFLQDLKNFKEFWEKTMENFLIISQTEFTLMIQENQELVAEMKDFLENTLGFDAQKNSEFLELLYLRKLAQKLKNKDSVRFINFDYYQRLNRKLNYEKIKSRRTEIITKVDRFENSLKSKITFLKQKLSKYLNFLHIKRNTQLEDIFRKYNKLKNLLNEVTTKEKRSLYTFGKQFKLHPQVPKLDTKLTINITDKNNYNIENRYY